MGGKLLVGSPRRLAQDVSQARDEPLKTAMYVTDYTR